jgi:hypothetical protein
MKEFKKVNSPKIKQEEIDSDFMQLKPPKPNMVKTAHDTGDGWYFAWWDLDSNGDPEEPEKEYIIDVFPFLSGYASSEDLSQIGIYVL